MPTRPEIRARRSRPEAVPSGVVRGAASAVQALRDSLCRGDAETAQALRWLAPRPPGERDLFSDMAAAEGLQTAVERLGRFWLGAETKLEWVRAVTEREAEIYERLGLRGEQLPIVSVVRRDDVDSPWKVVCTNEAPDERFRVWVTATAEVLDDVSFSRRDGVPGDLLMDGDNGVLGHRAMPWLIHLNGPFSPPSLPDVLPAGSRVVELTVPLVPNGEARHAQLCWLLDAAGHVLDQCVGEAAYLPDQHRLLLPDEMRSAAVDELLPRHRFNFWARIREVDEHIVTEGLGRLGLPELELRLDVLKDATLSRTVVERFGAMLTATPHLPSLGTELLVDRECLTLVPGRRGPRRGTSYGRFGAFGLERWDPSRRGSRTRIRIPV
ncbi:MAG: hypothetical protein AB8I08_14010 [Sandaracinaceae bacterium]